MPPVRSYRNATLWRPGGWQEGAAFTVVDGRIAAPDGRGADLGGALVTPGGWDLQVNGGGGLMLGDVRDAADLDAIAAAHRRLGTRHILPTLISDRPETVARVADAIDGATDRGILGLHLEGPHLAIPGAHDPAHLRPMADADLATYLTLARRLPHLMITLAPERVRTDGIVRLAEAGVLVSLGHSAATEEEARAALDAGARMATHLFNAMGPLHHRAPGLAGTALDRAPFVGLIADGHHVHESLLRIVARAARDRVILVSDAMAVAGTGAGAFTLNGRTILRREGRLTLPDGTLAGADLSLAQAVRVYAAAADLPLRAALRAAIDTPWRALTGAVPDLTATGAPADLWVQDPAAPIPLADWTPS